MQPETRYELIYIKREREKSEILIQNKLTTRIRNMKYWKRYKYMLQPPWVGNKNKYLEWYWSGFGTHGQMAPS